MLAFVDLMDKFCSTSLDPSPLAPAVSVALQTQSRQKHSKDLSYC
jgi:hypothetical protein